MKKLLTFLLISTLSITMIFAKSSNEDADYYEEPVSEAGTTEEDNEKAPFFNFSSTATKRHIYGDELTINTFNAIGQIKQTDKALITYHLKNNTFGFSSPYMAAYYAVLMDEKGRTTLSNAYNKYLDDFKNKKLSRKDKKSKKAYGNITFSLNWGTIKASTPSRGTAKATLGYEFINNSPYFIISIPSTFNDYYLENDIVAKESIPLKYAFTKAQMEALLRGISDEALSTFVPSKMDRIDPASIFSDTYEDNETTESTTEEVSVEE